MVMSEIKAVLAALEGGPATIPEASRIMEVSPFTEKIKLPHYGGYEHFERTFGMAAETAREQVTYRWTMRTEIAELRASRPAGSAAMTIGRMYA